MFCAPFAPFGAPLIDGACQHREADGLTELLRKRFYEDPT
jgi:hypothetical protein